MADSKGWICLHRKIQECSIWDNDEKFDCRSAWIDLLLLANHEDKKTLFDGKPVVVKRGQRITSVRQLAERWHWGNDRTLRYLRLLESEKMIIKESDKRRTLITIVNYGVYNDMPNTNKNTDRTLTSTEPEHCPNTDPSQTTMNNNDNNDNNETNNTPLNPPKGEWDEDKHSNYENFEYLMQTEMNTVKNVELLESIKEWLKHKDRLKPKSKNHLQLVSIRKLANRVFKNASLYGQAKMIDAIDKSIMNNYQGIVWDWVEDNKKPVGDGKQESDDEWLARKERELNDRK